MKMSVQAAGGTALGGRITPCFACLLVCLWAPLLAKAQCPKPSGENMVLSKDDLLKNDFPEGSNATFECALGYVRAGGSRTITCTSGSWTELKLQCKKKSCGSPGEIPNGVHELPDGVDFGAMVIYSCDKGYRIVGTNYRQCLPLGWSGRNPTCEVVKCGDPPEIPNGRIIDRPLKEYPEYQDVLQYGCNKPYVLIGSSQIACEANGEYDLPVPVCKNVSCPALFIKDGYRDGGGPPPYVYRNVVTLKCKEGYEMSGTAKLECSENGWSAPTPTCNLVKTTSTTTQSTTTTTIAQKGSGPDNKDNEGNEHQHNTGLIIGLSVLGVVIFILLVGCLLYHHFQKNKGEYHTKEDQKSSKELL